MVRLTITLLWLLAVGVTAANPTGDILHFPVTFKKLDYGRLVMIPDKQQVECAATGYSTEDCGLITYRLLFEPDGFQPKADGRVSLTKHR